MNLTVKILFAVLALIFFGAQFVLSLLGGSSGKFNLMAAGAFCTVVALFFG